MTKLCVKNCRKCLTVTYIHKTTLHNNHSDINDEHCIKKSLQWEDHFTHKTNRLSVWFLATT